MHKLFILTILSIVFLNLSGCIFDEENAEVCFIGDSITYAWDLDLFFPNTINYKFAQNGAWIQAIDSWDISECQGKKTVLLMGTNNIGPLKPDTINQDSVEKEFAELYIKHAKNINASKLLAISILPRKSKGQTAETNIFLFEQNKVLQKYLKQSDIKYKFIDVFGLFIDNDFNLIEPYFKDGVHPNISGYEILSREVGKHL